MSTLYVVRHGQARLFTEDYDRLSDLGFSQATELGRHWIERELQPDAVWCGSLLRQRQTADTVGQVFTDGGKLWPEHKQLDGFNEYPAEEIMRTLLPVLRARRDDIAATANAFEAAKEQSDRYRHMHRLLEAVIACWVDGDYEDGLLPLSWNEFSGGVREAFRQSMAEARRGATIAVFTSGGPIGVSMQTAMESPEIKAAELNWRVYNCSVTRYTFSGTRISLDHFNDISHLPAELHTYR
jgi:broad specificity phosphatase PhoE